MPPKELAKRIRAFAKLVSHYSDPLPHGWCAESLAYRDVKIAELNGFPVQNFRSTIGR